MQKPPPLSEHDGRPVTWDPWEVALTVTHITHECKQCGHAGQPWHATGTVAPAPGATFAVHEQKYPGGCWRERRKPAWPIRRLFAYRCPACGANSVYDWGEDGGQWVTLISSSGQGSLF